MKRLIMTIWLLLIILITALGAKPPRDDFPGVSLVDDAPKPILCRS